MGFLSRAEDEEEYTGVALRAGHWRIVQRPRMWVAVVSIAILLAGCGSDEATRTTSSSEAPSTTAPEAASPEAVPLEGTWRTDAISPRDAEATLRRYGLRKWIKRFRPFTPFAATTTLILDIKEGEWDLYRKPSGGPREEIDYDAEYVVKGNKVDKIHATGVTTYRWSVDGDTLTFEWLKSTEPPYEGIPDEVFSRALYMTQDFRRQG